MKKWQHCGDSPAQALALGADMEWRCEGEGGRAAVHQSILSGSVMACEFLILNNAKIDAVEDAGNSALHMAAQLGNTGQVRLLLLLLLYLYLLLHLLLLLLLLLLPLLLPLLLFKVCLLLKHHADHHLRNKQGQEPLDIAVANSDADIVTLLRLAALNEEIREADTTLHDDTFHDVVQEFCQMRYTHPERLQKKLEKK